MIRLIVLDSSPLSLLTQRSGVPLADECKRWASKHASAGVRLLIPEIVDYELRRELLRLNRSTSLARLDALQRHGALLYQPLTTATLRHAATRDGEACRRPIPWLWIDVILAAQALAEGVDPAEMVVATSNVGHLAQFCSREGWQDV